jgi:hypothetical protein
MEVVARVRSDHMNFETSTGRGEHANKFDQNYLFLRGLERRRGIRAQYASV